MLAQVLDAISIMELRDKQLEDFITPQYRSRVVGATGRQIAVGSSIWVTYIFDGLDYDETGNFSPGPYTTYTAPINGYYSLTAKGLFFGFNANSVRARFLVNGVDSTEGGIAPSFAGTLAAPTCATTLYLNATDTVVFQVLQDSGASQNTFTADRDQWFAVHLLSTQVYA